MNLTLKEIRTDGGTQTRAAINEETVSQYAEDMQAGAYFPPIVVFYDGSFYWLADGFHRVMAATQAEKQSLEADVKHGTRRDAILYSVGANGKHGLRRTNEDKRRAIIALLDDEEWCKWSDRKIAELCGVGHPLVGDCRRFTSGRINQIEPVKYERNGKTFEMQVPRNGPRNIEFLVDSAEFYRSRSNAPQNLQAHPQAAALEVSESVTPKSNVVTLEQWKAMDANKRTTVLQSPRSATIKLNDQKTDNIEWAMWSWNPITGCKHNCPYCYARDIANRFYPHGFEPAFIAERLGAPANTKVPPEAAENIGYKNVFTCSMADLFGKWVPREWIEAVLQVVRDNPQWNFLFLTKFPVRMAEFDYPDNAWLGTTVDCQARVDNAEKAFKRINAKVKWLSCEPLLEPLRFSNLEMFQWVVLGGSSKSTQTPKWKPPREWINRIEDIAHKAGCKVYEKTNLIDRLREYPGISQQAAVLPEALRYLPSI